MDRTPFRPTSAVGLALVVLLAAGASSAKPEYGEAVDAFCSQNGRTPAQPFNGDCRICHNPDDNTRDQTPGYDEFRSHRSDGDFSYFCPIVAGPNQPPVLDPIGDQMVDEGGVLSLHITAADPEGGSVLLEAADLPTGAVFQDNGDGSGDFAWMPGYDRAGTYSVLFRASDSASPPAIASETITISVGDVNRPPQLDPVGNRSVAAGELLAFTLSATDPDLDAVRFGASGLPPTSELVDLGNGSAEFSWLTTATDVGNVSITFSVSDDGVPMLSASESIVVTVGDVNRPPALAAIGSQLAHPGALFVLNLSASDPDGDGLHFELDGLPTGATFNDLGDGSAQLLWTPEADQTGNYALRATVVDDGVPAESDAEDFSISVGEVNRPPRLDPLVLREEGGVLAIDLVAHDPDGDGLRITATGVPAGASFVDAGDGTATFRWDPPVDLVGTFPLRFEVTDDGLPPESTTSGTVITLAGESATASAGSVGGGSWRSPWACGLGFEVVFTLPLVLRLRRRLRGGSGVAPG